MESMKCPSCGSNNLTRISQTDYECNHCKTKSKLSDDKNFLVIIQGYPCPECGFGNETDVKFCGNCGVKMIKYCLSCFCETRLGLRYCPNCGNSEFRKDKLVDAVFNSGIFVGGTSVNKIEAIKIVRRITNMGLVEAKNFVEEGGILATGLLIDKGEELKNEFLPLGNVDKIINLVPSKSSQSENNGAQYSGSPSSSEKKDSCFSVLMMMFVVGIIIVNLLIWLI